jgi:hypothetical protein
LPPSARDLYRLALVTPAFLAIRHAFGPSDRIERVDKLFRAAIDGVLEKESDSFVIAEMCGNIERFGFKFRKSFLRSLQ